MWFQNKSELYDINVKCKLNTAVMKSWSWVLVDCFLTGLHYSFCNGHTHSVTLTYSYHFNLHPLVLASTRNSPSTTIDSFSLHLEAKSKNIHDSLIRSPTFDDFCIDSTDSFSLYSLYCSHMIYAFYCLAVYNIQIHGRQKNSPTCVLWQ